MRKSDLEVLRNEGSQGVENLAKICEAIGYQGKQLQMSNGSFVTSITEFLEDNPDAVRALFEFISDNNDNFPEPLEEDADEDEDEDELSGLVF